MNTVGTMQPPMLEKALIWYARRFPVGRGKLRLVNKLWPWAVRAEQNSSRVASLIYGDLKVPCDVSKMLQRQFYFFGTYYSERHLLCEWSALARQAQVVFDIGANAGIYSLAAHAANPGAALHAFEPTPEIAERLRDTTRLNNLTQLNVHEVAVGAFNGPLTLVRCSGGSDNDGMNYVQRTSHPEGVMVMCTTLDVFCQENHIRRVDLLKMDVQGAEEDVLQGAQGLLSRGAIGTIFMELNWEQDPRSCAATRALSLLESHGFQFSSPSSPRSRVRTGNHLRSLSEVIARHEGGIGND